MAYNVAANMQFAKPVSSFIDARDNVTRNALAERQVANQEGAQAFQQQRLSATDQIEAQRRKAEEDKQDATYMHNALSYLTRASENPQVYQSVAQKLMNDPVFQKHGGLDEASLTPENIQAELASLAATAGIAPAARFEEKTGPRGSLYKRNIDTGETAQVIGPDNTEAPNYAERRPQFVKVTLPDGTEQNQWVMPGQATGTPVGAPVRPTKDDARAFSKADKLRDEFNTQSKDFINVGDSYNIVQEVAKSPDAAGDLSMIFAFMKMLDPNSVVREQEFANAQNAAGIPDRIRNQYNKVLSGERLNPTQRAEFIGQAKNLFNARKARQDVITKRYTEMAKRNGVNPDDVVGDLSVLMPTETPPAASPGATRVPDGVAIYNKSKSGRDIVSVDGGKNWTYK